MQLFDTSFGGDQRGPDFNGSVALCPSLRSVELQANNKVFSCSSQADIVVIYIGYVGYDSDGLAILCASFSIDIVLWDHL